MGCIFVSNKITITSPKGALFIIDSEFSVPLIKGPIPMPKPISITRKLSKKAHPCRQQRHKTAKYHPKLSPVFEDIEYMQYIDYDSDD
jgi:hypothetical protein